MSLVWCYHQPAEIAAPRSVAKHYFDEHINTPSEYADDGSMYSSYSAAGSEWYVHSVLQKTLLTRFRDEPEPDDL